MVISIQLMGTGEPYIMRVCKKNLKTYYGIFMQRLINNVANAQIGILTTHSGQQLAQNSLVDFFLRQ